MRIEDRLNRAATAVDAQVGSIPMRPAEDVSRRNQRQRIATIVSGSALALVLIVGSAFMFAGGSGTTVPTTPTDSAPVAALSTDMEPSDLDWETVESTVRYLDNSFGWDGKLYALSTIPGRSPDGEPASRALYSSSDGVVWSEGVIADDLWISNVDSYGGTIYAISTAPGLADVSAGLQVRITTTNDFGTTWNEIDLPAIAAPPSELGSVQWLSAGTKVAAGPAGVVATAKGFFGMDFAPLIPEEFRSVHHYVTATDVGIEVRDQRLADEAEAECYEESVGAAPVQIDSSGEVPATTVAPVCDIEYGGVVYTATWEELGYPERPQTSFSRMYVSTDGSNFDSVAPPFGPDHLDQLIATDDGFLAVEAAYGSDRSAWRLWTSREGRRWEQTTRPSGADYVQHVGSFGDKLILLAGAGEDWFRVFSSEDFGRSWDEVTLPTLATARDGFIGPFPIDVDVSDQGVVIALVFEPTGDAEGWPVSQVIMTDDLTTWSEVPLSALGAGTGYVTGILNTGDLVLISMSNFDGPDVHTTLVGSRT